MEGLRAFGFEYPHNGKNFATHVLAESIDDARARLSALANAHFVGELKVADDAAKRETVWPCAEKTEAAA